MRKKFENVGRQLFLRDPSSFSPVIKRSSMKTNGVLEAATPTKKDTSLMCRNIMEVDFCFLFQQLNTWYLIQKAAPTTGLDNRHLVVRVLGHKAIIHKCQITTKPARYPPDIRSGFRLVHQFIHLLFYLLIHYLMHQ